MSTIDNVFVLFNLIIHFLNKSEKLYCAFVDFTKAFDYIVRDVVWYKLLKAGVRGRMLDIIKSIYDNVKSQVKHNNTLSCFSLVISGSDKVNAFHLFCFLCV